MTYSAVFFGSIGVLTETSELQRLAFNAAFDEAGLDWRWASATYAQMLRHQGGRARIERYAEMEARDVDIEALYQLKQTAFDALVRAERPPLRAGVFDLIYAARRAEMGVALVTSTSPAQVATVFAGLDGTLARSDFDYVGDRSRVAAAKPAPDIYLDALAQLNLEAGDVLVIEDTPESAGAAQAAGLRVVGFPGCAARRRSFPDGVPVLEFLSPTLLLQRPLRIAAE